MLSALVLLAIIAAPSTLAAPTKRWTATTTLFPAINLTYAFSAEFTFAANVPPLTEVTSINPTPIKVEPLRVVNGTIAGPFLNATITGGDVILTREADGSTQETAVISGISSDNSTFVATSMAAGFLTGDRLLGLLDMNIAGASANLSNVEILCVNGPTAATIAGNASVDGVDCYVLS